MEGSVGEECVEWDGAILVGVRLTVFGGLFVEM